MVLVFFMSIEKIGETLGRSKVMKTSAAHLWKTHELFLGMFLLTPFRSSIMKYLIHGGDTVSKGTTPSMQFII
jgi:hypothetical protein